MNSRERVMLAYEHKEPDRVPVCIGGTAQKFAKEIYLKLKRNFEINSRDSSENEMDELGNVIHYHEDLLNLLGSDFRHLHINRTPCTGVQPDGSCRHELGFKLKENKQNGIVNIISHPLTDSSPEEIKNFAWPDPCDKKRFEGVEERAKHLFENTDFAIAVYKATLLGIFDLCCVMRGMDKFLMDMMLDERTTNLLIEKAFEFNFQVYESLLKRIGKYVQVVEFNDDLGTQENLFIPPELYRKFLKPRHKELVTMFRKQAPGAKVFLHSCGSIYDIIPDFIEIGIDILNPVQPSANKMNTHNLKREFGKDICFQGGIDLQKALIGSIKDVESEVKERIGSLAVGGGYVFATANNIGNDVPVENVLRLFEFAKEYGKYPISIG